MGYIFLSLAIGGELLGTTLLKYAEGFTKLLPSVFSLLAYGICFFFLSKALTHINLSLAYAVWSGLGIAAAAVLSVFLFKEAINAATILGIVLILAGVLILNLFGVAHG